MVRLSFVTNLMLCVLSLSHHSLAQEGKRGNTAAAERITREAVAKFESGDPGWKVRMESLVRLVKAGPGTVPILIDTLKSGSPTAREFAAQVLVVISDHAARPALARALDDPDPRVHIYAIKALNMLGRLELSEAQREQLKKGAGHWMQEYVDFVAERKEVPSPEAMRKALLSFDLAKMETAGVGRLAPEFALRDAEGKVHRLGEFRNKKVVILQFDSGAG